MREKVYQRLANEVFFRVLHGEYALGAKLSSIGLKEAGSSPETIRKAILELQQHSVIERMQWVVFYIIRCETVIATYRQQYLEAVEKILAQKTETNS